jgi:hypothetical protein
MGGINMKDDPIQYAKNMAIKSIDDTEEIRLAIKDLTDSYKYQIDKLKGIIKEYFSDEVQMDETPMGAMRRNQIRKELLQFANK